MGRMTLAESGEHPPLSQAMDRRILPGLIASALGAMLALTGSIVGLGALVIAGAACVLVGAVALGAAAFRVQTHQYALVAETQSATLASLEVYTVGPPRSIVDSETGLADERYFDRALDGRVAAARRNLWPITVVLVEVGLPHRLGEPSAPPPEAIAAFAALMRRTLREADLACRIGPTRFALLLEDTSDEGGVWAAERIQISLAKAQEALPGRALPTRMVAGVASYPNHALRADELLGAARSALARAMGAEHSHGLGPVEVARSES
jgi:diguanylate cyclase (GGDEF)-like protein